MQYYNINLAKSQITKGIKTFPISTHLSVLNLLIVVEPSVTAAWLLIVQSLTLLLIKVVKALRSFQQLKEFFNMCHHIKQLFYKLKPDSARFSAYTFTGIFLLPAKVMLALIIDAICANL